MCEEPHCELSGSDQVSFSPLIALHCPLQVLRQSGDSWTGLWRHPADEGRLPPRWRPSPAQRSEMSLLSPQCHTARCGGTTTGRCYSSEPNREMWRIERSGYLWRDLLMRSLSRLQALTHLVECSYTHSHLIISTRHQGQKGGKKMFPSQRKVSTLPNSLGTNSRLSGTNF